MFLGRQIIGAINRCDYNFYSYSYSNSYSNSYSYSKPLFIHRNYKPINYQEYLKNWREERHKEWLKNNKDWIKKNKSNDEINEMDKILDTKSDIQEINQIEDPNIKIIIDKIIESNKADVDILKELFRSIHRKLFWIMVMVFIPFCDNYGAEIMKFVSIISVFAAATLKKMIE